MKTDNDEKMLNNIRINKDKVEVQALRTWKCDNHKAEEKRRKLKIWREKSFQSSTYYKGDKNKGLRKDYG